MDLWNIFNALGSLAFFVALVALASYLRHRSPEANQAIASAFGPGVASAAHAVDRPAVERHLAPVVERRGLTKRGLGWFAGTVDGRACGLGVGQPGQLDMQAAFLRGHQLLIRVEFQRPLGLGLTPGGTCPELHRWMGEPDVAWLTRTLRQAGGTGCVTDAAVEVTFDDPFTSPEACHHVLGWTAQLAEKLERRCDALPPDPARDRRRSSPSTSASLEVPERHAGRRVALETGDPADVARAYLRAEVSRPLGLQFALHASSRGGVSVLQGVLYGAVAARAWQVCPEAPTFFVQAYEGRFCAQGRPSDRAHALLSRPDVVAAIGALDPIVTDVFHDDAALHLALDRVPGPAETEALLAQQERILAALEG